MKFPVPAVLVALILAAGCARQTMTLPDDPVGRAATCGVIETEVARAQGGEGINKPLAVETQGRILHYALLAASAGKSYDASIAAAVVKRLPAIADAVTADDWQKLRAPCAAAFPAVAKTATSLPSDPLTAALGCDELATFMRTALARQSYAFGSTLDQYDRLNRALDQRIAVLFSKRGIMALAARLAQRNKALAAIVEHGSPVPMLKLCTAHYG
jgi:hypothetical protein